MDVPAFVLTMPIVALATAVLSGTFGMGGGVILFAILLVYFEPEQAVVLHGLTALSALVYRSYTFRRHIYWNAVWYYLGGATIAALLYSLMAVPLTRSFVALALGLMCLSGAILPRILQLNIIRSRQAVGAGLLNTLLSLSTGMAVGLIDLFFLRAPLSRFEVLGTKAALFVFACVIKSAYYLAVLIDSPDSDLKFLYILPSLSIAAIVGTEIGGKVVERLSECRFRKSITVILAGLGAVFLSKEVIAYWAML